MLPQRRPRGRFVLVLIFVLALATNASQQLFREETHVFDGLSQPIRPIHVVRPTEDIYNAEFQHVFYNAATRLTSCQQYGLRELGILGKPPARRRNVNFLEWLLEETGVLHPSTYPAFYKAGTDTIYVLRDDKIILSHEWVHALHDQYANFHALFEQAKTTDELLALRAIIEGVAVVFSSGMPTPLSPRPTIDGNAFYLAYTLAPTWVKSRAHGRPVNAFGLYAESAYEIMFDRPRSPVALPPASLDAGEEIACTDRLGVLGLLSLLRQAGAHDYQIDQILRSWRSDRLDVVAKTNGQYRLVWNILFDSERAAEIWRELAISSILLTEAWNVALSISVSNEN